MIEHHLVHACTWLVVRVLPWRMALPTVRRMARFAPPFGTVDEARRSFVGLRGGTCLTKSLATSIRLPGSEVVFGVRRDGDKGSRFDDEKLLAHAWVCVGGAPLVPDSSSGAVISRVDLVASSR